MKKLALALALTLAASSVWAACRYYTITVNGRTLYCTECCFGTVCNTTCN